MHTAQYILNLKYKGRQLMPTNVENIEKQEYVTAVFMSRSVLKQWPRFHAWRLPPIPSRLGHNEEIHSRSTLFVSLAKLSTL